MKTLVFHGPFDMRLEEAPIPKIMPTEVLVKTAAVGICGSDIHGFAGKTGRRAPGMVMGHEISGTIESSGNGAKRFSIGQRVVIQPIIGCQKCEMCLGGNVSICSDKNMIGVNMGAVGGLAEYIAVPEDNVLPIPDNLQHSLAFLAEPFAVGVSVAHKAAAEKNHVVLIVGSGVIGLCILLILQNTPTSKVFVVDQNVQKLEIARQFGAIPINFSKDNPIERIMRETNGKGADVSIEAVGMSESVKTAMYGTKNGGRILWVGNSQKIIELDMQDVVVKGKSVQGVYCYSKEDFREAITFIDQNRSLASRFVEMRIPPEQAPQLFSKLAKGETEMLRGVILFEDLQ